MKQVLIPLFAVAAFISLTAAKCSKSDYVDPVSEYYPQYWIMTIDESTEKYTLIRTNGANCFRRSVLKSYSLVQLAEDEQCKFEIEQSLTEVGSKKCVSIRLEKNKKIWLGAAKSPNKQEVHLYALNTTSTDPGDNFKFFVHNIGKVDGVKTVALESVYFPGYYISSAGPGLEYAQNQVTLQQATSPQKATAWACR